MGIADDIGQGIGGLFRNPGILALGALGIGLFIFRKPIQEAFANFGGQISNLFSPAGAIQAAGAQAGQFVFNIGQDVGGSVFDAGQATGDVVGKFIRDAQQQIDNFLKVAESDITIGTSNFAKDIVETLTTESEADRRRGGDPLANLLGQADTPIFKFPTETLQPEFIGAPSPGQSQLDPFDESLLDRPLSLFDFATRFNLTPSEAFSVQKDFGGTDFSEIAAIPTFGEVLQDNPDLTASQIANLKFIQAGGGEDFDFGTNTGLALELAGANFGSNTFLKREDPNFSLLLEAEALRANQSLGGGSGGLFANPDFPITLGEAFLGKSGTIVSQSISNLTDDQLKDFIERFG